MDSNKPVVKAPTEEQIAMELNTIESQFSDELIFDYQGNHLYYEENSIDSFVSDEVVNHIPFCVLCGCSKINHKKTHRFILCKEQHRCISCGKFFYEHTHINSCYQPFVPVQMGGD